MQSALQATEQALALGMREDRIVLSCKSSLPKDLIAVYRDLAEKTRNRSTWPDGGRAEYERDNLERGGHGRAA